MVANVVINPNNPVFYIDSLVTALLKISESGSESDSDSESESNSESERL